jgi:hypothetical protein
MLSGVNSNDDKPLEAASCAENSNDIAFLNENMAWRNEDSVSQAEICFSNYSMHLILLLFSYQTAHAFV